jgi:hypothetical protein
MLTHVLSLAVTLAPHPPSPHALVDTAIAAMQRTTALREARSLRLVGIQHEFILGNAERAEGPWRTSYSQFSELRDLTAPALRRTEQGLSASGAKSPDRVTVLTDSVVALMSGGRQFGSSHAAYEDWIDRIDGSPERALLIASASHALAYDRAVTRFGKTFDVVSFPWRNGRMRLELDRDTHLPDAIDIVRPYPDNFRWAPFGDVTIRTVFVAWTVTPRGTYWPMQQKVTLNGEPLRDVSYATATLDPAPPSADSFAVSDSARVQYAAASKLNFSQFRFGARGLATELEPGIVRVPDQWMQTLVKQADGIVIFEAHISAPYLHEVIDEAHKRWPDSPIKALVVTSDPWAHLGGVREAMALGIPIYVSAGSVPFLTGLANTPHVMAPDSLARSRRPPKFVPVSGKTVIGKGENRIELYPVGGPYAERMLMAYFPDHRLLYGADLVFFNRGPDGKPTAGFLETEATDLRHAVAREGLAVDTLICVQNYPPIPWKTFAGSAGSS